jgi:hypothetical protein
MSPKEIFEEMHRLVEVENHCDGPCNSCLWRLNKEDEEGHKCFWISVKRCMNHLINAKEYLSLIVKEDKTYGIVKYAVPISGELYLSDVGYITLSTGICKEVRAILEEVE